MLADKTHGGCLRTFVADGFREAYFLSRLKILEARTNHTIAMKIDLPPIGCGDEAMVPFRRNRCDNAVRRRRVHFHITIDPAELILQLPAGCIECIPDRDMHILMPPTGCRIPIDIDMSATWHRNMDPDAVDIALVLPVLGSREHHADGRNPIVKALEPFCLLVHSCLEGIGMIEMLKGDLEWNLHGTSPCWPGCTDPGGIDIFRAIPCGFCYPARCRSTLTRVKSRAREWMQIKP